MADDAKFDRDLGSADVAIRGHRKAFEVVGPTYQQHPLFDNFCDL